MRAVDWYESMIIVMRFNMPFICKLKKKLNNDFNWVLYMFSTKLTLEHVFFYKTHDYVDPK